MRTSARILLITAAAAVAVSPLVAARPPAAPTVPAEQVTVDLAQGHIPSWTYVADEASIAFLGDSITAWFDVHGAFGDIDVVNLGIPGNTTDDILNRMHRGVLPLHPAKVFLMIGTNDLGRGGTVTHVVENTERIIDRIVESRPDTLIYLQSIYPVHEADDLDVRNRKGIRTNATIQEANALLADLAIAKGVQFVDVYGALVGLDGQLPAVATTDGLHLSAEGYDPVVAVLGPLVSTTAP